MMHRTQRNNSCDVDDESNMLRLLHDTAAGLPEATHLPNAHIIVELTPAWTPDQLVECFGINQNGRRS